MKIISMKIISMMMLGMLMLMSPAVSLANAAQSEVTQDDVAKTIDRFVATLYPKGSHYFWVINDALSETWDEIIVDINTTLHLDHGQPPLENRFLLLIVKGQLVAAHNIPLEAEVDCQQEHPQI
ncbi:MAG: hypothetical protein D6690_00550 [Nitrospirae bacterium]|nr:MAG: hypothetical protein D6690_00550 [Nitrospirota bacterium]